MKKKMQRMSKRRFIDRFVQLTTKYFAGLPIEEQEEKLGKVERRLKKMKKIEDK